MCICDKIYTTRLIHCFSPPLKFLDPLTGVPRWGGLKGFNPLPLNFLDFLNCVFAKYTVQALLYSLNPKFCTGKG